MNKFNAVVRDSFQAKNNETLAFDFYIHKLFLERDHLRNTSSNCLLRRVVKHQCPELQFTRKQSTRGPPKCFQSSAKPKIHLLEGKVPSTGKDTYQMKKPSLFGEWLSHGAQSKIFLQGRLYCSTKDLRNVVAYKNGIFPADGIYCR